MKVFLAILRININFHFNHGASLLWIGLEYRRISLEKGWNDYSAKQKYVFGNIKFWRIRMFFFIHFAVSFLFFWIEIASSLDEVSASTKTFRHSEFIALFLSRFRSWKCFKDWYIENYRYLSKVSFTLRNIFSLIRVIFVHNFCS